VLLRVVLLRVVRLRVVRLRVVLLRVVRLRVVLLLWVRRLIVVLLVVVLLAVVPGLTEVKVAVRADVAAVVGRVEGLVGLSCLSALIAGSPSAALAGGHVVGGGGTFYFHGFSLLEVTPCWELLYLFSPVGGTGSSFLLGPGLTGLFLGAILLEWILATEVDLFSFLPRLNAVVRTDYSFALRLGYYAIPYSLRAYSLLSAMSSASSSLFIMIFMAFLFWRGNIISLAFISSLVPS
jgi:hypothetical protein